MISTYRPREEVHQPRPVGPNLSAAWRGCSMLEQFFDLRGRVGLVSGAAQGLGRAMARALAAAGMDLLVVDRNTEGVRKTAEELTRLGRRITPATCDVSDPGQIRALFAQVDREWGRIDFLGNVAGNGPLG